MSINANLHGNSKVVNLLSCTFEEAEERTLLANINASTRSKVEFFEEMIEMGFRFGAIKPRGPITFEELASAQKLSHEAW